MSQKNVKITDIFKITSDTECAIPFAQSLISAGFPSAAENSIEQALDLNDLLIKHPTATFFVRVLGDSMINAGIRSHDILIVDRALTPVNNKIAVVRIYDEFTVKRLHFQGSRLFLVADNDHYEPIEIKEGMDFEIWGIVTYVIHNVSL